MVGKRIDNCVCCGVTPPDDSASVSESESSVTSSPSIGVIVCGCSGTLGGVNLTVTISSSTCPFLDGATITLFYQSAPSPDFGPQEWVGSVTPACSSSETVTFTLTCGKTGSCTADHACSDFDLTVTTVSPACFLASTSKCPDSCTCVPLELIYDFGGFAMSCGCCTSGSVDLIFTITE